MKLKTCESNAHDKIQDASHQFLSASEQNSSIKVVILQFIILKL